MTRRITRQPQDQTSTGLFCKVDNVVAASFHRFNFVEDTRNRRYRTVPTCSIVGDGLKVLNGFSN